MGAENIKEKHRRFSLLMILLIAAASATVAISVMVSEEAFASDSTSQAAAVDNTCLNPIFDSNEDIDNAVGVGNCGGAVSQQDESGSASAPITSQTANPDIELQRATTSQPGLGASMTCEECFDILSATQETAVEQLLAGDSNPLDDELWGANPPTTIEELCAMYATFTQDQKGEIADGDITELLGDAGATQPTLNQVIRCLNASPSTPAG
jgi:hypothetical protein